MKHFVFLLFLNIIIYAQFLQFNNNFLFSNYDSTQFLSISYNDKNWRPISINVNWDHSGYKDFDGIGWYRYHFSIQNVDSKSNYYLLLGKIDDADETYLNEKLIGKTGSISTSQPESKWGELRIYKIPKNTLRKNNVLAIRVLDMGGPGGIYEGPFGIYTEKEVFTLLKEYKNKKFKYLVTSNGLLCAIINRFNGTIEKVYPEIYQAFDSSSVIQPILKNIKFDIKEEIKKIEYFKQTNIIKIDYSNYTLYILIPFTINQKILIIKAVSKNENKINPKYEIEDNSIDFKEIPINDRTKYFVFSYAKEISQSLIDKIKVDQIIEENINYFETIFKKINKPYFKSKVEEEIFRQSVTVLKMAQVSNKSDFIRSRGQILASLPPGNWNICWIRDGVYSIFALNNLGLFDEAKDALEFYLNAKSGYYKNFIFKNKDYGIGKDYKISVCRYFGNGSEESDANDDGPNIEIDGFGLFLQAFSDYVKKSGDTLILRKYKNVIDQYIIEPIIFSIDNNGLIRKESGAWERHLPGKQFAYTSISCAKGLLDYAILIKDIDKNLYEKLFKSFNEISYSLNYLYEKDGYYRGTYENKNKNEVEHFDALSFEIFNTGINNNKNIFINHYRNYEKALRISKSRGFARVNSQDWYDRKEWIFIDFRIASSLNKFGLKKDADKILNWVIKKIKENNYLIPELLDEKDSTYQGAVPMVGFGAASYINYLFERK